MKKMIWDQVMAINNERVRAHIKAHLDVDRKYDAKLKLIRKKCTHDRTTRHFTVGDFSTSTEFCNDCLQEIK
jgi:hypothetical protein